MKLPALTPALLRLQTPAVRAQLAALAKPKRKRTLKPGAVVAFLPSTHPATVDADGTVRVLVPLVLPSLANMRGDWAKAAAVLAARKALYHREVLGDRLGVVCGALAGVTPPKPPLLVTLTRIASRRLDPTVNLPGSLKGIEDAVAAWLNVDDARDDLVRYVVTQEKGPPAVRVVVETRSER